MGGGGGRGCYQTEIFIHLYCDLLKGVPVTRVVSSDYYL